jgi:hypothetical protein
MNLQKKWSEVHHEEIEAVYLSRLKKCLSDFKSRPGIQPSG